MGSDLRASLSSFGDGLDSGFDSGFDSGLIGFDFTCDHSPVFAPFANRLSRKGSEIRCTGIGKEGCLEHVGFKKAGTFTLQAVQVFQICTCNNYQIA
jgi:hypothetical protein